MAERGRTIYKRVVRESRNGLAVAIGPYGLRATEMTDCVGLLEAVPRGAMLLTRVELTWNGVRDRLRNPGQCYSGADGCGTLRKRMVDAAIEALAYSGHSSEEDIVTRLDSLNAEYGEVR